MSYKILTKNGVDNTNIDGARAEFFNSGMRNGIVRGAFSEGTFSSNASNSVYLDTCELRISGHRIIIDEPVYKTFSNTPANNTRYSFIAQVSVDDTSVVSFSIIIQDAKTSLRQDNLFATETGAGIYQLEIGRFTLSTAGVITDIVRTADVITGGGEDENTYIEIGEVTTTMVDNAMDAEVDIENVLDEQTGKKKTNFNFTIPTTKGTVVNVAGNQEAVVNFDSDPQTQINDKQNQINILNNNKVEKEEGKGLSTNDYTTAEKNKLNEIEAGANVNRPIYSGIGQNTNGSMTQKAVTDEFAKKAEKDASNLTETNKQSWRTALVNNWVESKGNLQTSVNGNFVKLDLSPYLPSVSGNEMYEVLLSSYLDNSSGSVGSESYNGIYTDLLGNENNYWVMANGSSQVTSKRYHMNASIIVPVHRYIWNKTSTADNFVLRIHGYRRIK